MSDTARLDGVPSGDLEQLRRWEDAGGAWQVLAYRPGEVELALLACTLDEQMGRLLSREPDLLAYVVGVDPGPPQRAGRPESR